MKRVRFSLEHLVLLLGEIEIDGGPELQKFNMWLGCFDTDRTYLRADLQQIVRELNAVCKLRTVQVLELYNLSLVLVL